ncbi:MAG: hypothetical protein ACOYL6_17260 [Bacteriovoracaceae bacterium]
MKLSSIFIFSSLLFSSLAMADWTDQFVGSMNFRLLDDPDYSRLYNDAKDSEKRLGQWKAEVEQRKRHLNLAAQNRHGKETELKNAQDLLVRKNQLVVETTSNYNSLIPQVPTAQAQIDSLKVENTGLQNEINGLNSEVQKLEASLSSSASVDADRAKLQGQITEANKNISNLQASITKNNNEIASLNSTIAQNEQKANDLAKQIEASQNSIPNIQNKISNLSSQLTSLKSELADKEKEYNTQTNDPAFKEQTALIERLKNNLNTNISKLNDRKSELDRKTSTLNQLSSNSANLKSQISNLEKKIQDLDPQLRDARESLSSAVSQIKEKSTQIETLKLEITSIEKHAADLTASMRSIKQNIDDLQKEIAAKPELAEQNKARIAQLNQAIKELAEQRNVLKEEAGKRTTSIANLQTQINELNTTSATLQKNISSFEADKATSQSTLEASRLKIVDVNNQIDSVSAEISSIGQSINELNGQISKTKEEIATREREWAQNNSEIVELKSIIDRLRSSVANANASLSGAKSELDQLNQSLVKMKQDLSNSKVANENASKRIQTLNGDITTASNSILSFQSKIRDYQSTYNSTDSIVAERIKIKANIDQLKNTLSIKNTKMADNNTQIKKNEDDIASLKKKIADTKSQLDSINAEIPKIQASITSLTSDVQQTIATETNSANALKEGMNAVAATESELNDDNGRLNSYANQLIGEILAINRQGLNRATNDGTKEGEEIAFKLGIATGQVDGKRDGLARGEADGRARDYAVGAKTGDQKGSADGKRVGALDGQPAGVNAGNKEAGRVAGADAGIKRAEFSDARSVGSNQGTKAGFDVAVIDGQNTGYALGEPEAIDNNEAGALADKTIQGQFSGTFSSSAPGFPGTKGSYFNNSVSNVKNVLAHAYVAGYNFGYNPAAEKAYYNNIRLQYDPSYNQAYASNYNLAFGNGYENSRAQGESDQYKISYKREYNSAYDSLFKRYYDITVAAPQIGSTEYMNAYKKADSDYYASQYESLRKASYSNAYAQSYKTNLIDQTAKYKAERMNQVNKLYSSFPVLKFVNENIWDSGIKGVGARDEIYMPGENVIHDLEFINYGGAANNVEIKIDDANTIILPSIPARSHVTIIGAAAHAISSSGLIGSIVTSKLVIRSPLSALEKSIQGRYFEKAGENLLARAKALDVRLNYPLTAQNPISKTDIYFKQKTKLSVTINNISKKPIKNVLLKLETSLGDEVISKPFAGLSSLDSSATIEGAEINVIKEEQMLSKVSFKVTATSNGVYLGESKFGGEQIVRAGYIEKDDKPVVAFSSASPESRALFQDLMNEAGGAANISILDLNGAADNDKILASQMTGKTILAILDKEGRVLTALNPTFTLNKVTVAILNGNDSSLNTARATLSNLKDSTILPMDFAGKRINVLTSSPLFNEAIKSKNSIVNFELQDLAFITNFAMALKYSNDELLESLVKIFTMDKFLAHGDDMILLNKMIALRAIEDVVGVASSYEEADNGRERRTLRRMFRREDELMLRKFRKVLEKGEKTSRMAASAAAYPLQNGLSFLLEEREPFKSLPARIQRNVVRSIRDFDNEAKRTIKNFVIKSTIKQIENMQSNYYLIK